MRGSMFVEFGSFVENNYGVDVADRVLEKCESQLSTGGAYTSVGNYPHTEMLTLAATLCEDTGADLGAMLHDFAGHILGTFQRMHPEFFETASLVAFLESVENKIHREVRKIYPDANPPRVTVERTDNGGVEVFYKSHRPLAPLAHALLDHSVAHFGEPMTIEVVDQSADNREVHFRMSPTQ